MDWDKVVKNGWIVNFILVLAIIVQFSLVYEMIKKVNKLEHENQNLHASIQNQSNAVNSLVADLKLVPCENLKPLFTKYGVR